jgi:hypothetical protein
VKAEAPSGSSCLSSPLNTPSGSLEPPSRKAGIQKKYGVINQAIIVQTFQMRSHRPLTLPFPPESGGKGRGEGEFSGEFVCSNMEPLVSRIVQTGKGF